MSPLSPGSPAQGGGLSPRVWKLKEWKVEPSQSELFVQLSVETLTCVFTGCISSSGSERQASPGGISAVQTGCKVREH